MKYTDEFSEEVIDGSTIEKRRDQRKEQLLRFVEQLSPEDRQGLVGKVNQWTKATGVQVVDADNSIVDLRAPAGAPKTVREYTETHAFAVPDVVKRTNEQRLDAFVKRLLSSPPEQHEAILAQVAGEYWKMGMPVTADALRTVAAHFLNRAERKAKA